MTREEYMYALQSCLYALSPEERAAALQYYAEYFDDAGPENEQQVMADLGSPQEVAKQILKDFAENRYPLPGCRPADSRTRRPALSGWMVLLGILLLPILLPLAIALIAVVFGLLVGILCLAAVLVIATVALILTGIAGTFGGIAGLAGWAAYPWQRWFSVGEAFIRLGTGLLLLPFCWWFFRSALPGLYRQIQNLLARQKKR
ncbi:MAG: DUF1700 domain-containing protein [Provencibacterium sp.]|jgi:uncharacterized membrane protein|nr:DUF1700 domain-containing protein [Provencibacterium sp.]